METRFPELRELEITVSDETRDRQWVAIQQAIAAVPEVHPFPLRRRVALWAAAVFTVGLPAGAVAAEDSIPGDLLYPVKLAVEPVRALFDSDVIAVHRVEELEEIVELDASPAEVDRALERADDATESVTSPELTQRVERVRQMLRDRRADVGDVTDRPVDRQPPAGDEAGTTTAPEDDRSTTTTVGDQPATTDDPPRDSDSGPSTTQTRDGTTSTSGPRDDSGFRDEGSTDG